jgi:alpha-beta hydrolase superfamily lysophospholipase
MKEATVNALLNDAVESLAIGKKIGQQVILIGTSTGATLATWLAAQKDSTSIAALVLLSPNYGLKRQESELLLYPWGKTLLNIIEGDEYSFTPVNDLQKQYWTTRYPSEALLNMMGIVEATRNAELQKIKIPTLIFYSDNDSIVSVEKIKTQFRRLSSANKRIVTISNASDPQQHILAGDILSPSTTNEIAAIIENFLSPIVNH